MTRSERERRRYIAVRNATLDPSLARKARGWSDDRILETLGVRVPKKIPKLKDLPKGNKLLQRQLVAQRKIAKYQYARTRGATIERAKTLKTASWERVREQTQVKPDTRKRYTAEERENRMDKWSEWSRRNNFPPSIKKMVYQINREAGFDPNAKYGWAVMFYSYIENEAIDKWTEQLEPDPHDGDKYIIATRGVA